MERQSVRDLMFVEKAILHFIIGLAAVTILYVSTLPTSLPVETFHLALFISMVTPDDDF